MVEIIKQVFSGKNYSGNKFFLVGSLKMSFFYFPIKCFKQNETLPKIIINV